MLAGDDTVAFLKLKNDLVAVLIYVGVKVARGRTKGEKAQADRGRIGFM
jgi:hypothetical protein